MRSLKLRLISTLSFEKYNSLYIDTKQKELIDTVEDESISLLLRKPALFELARRGDESVLAITQGLVQSASLIKREIGIEALSILGTPEALERLIIIAATLHNDERHYAVSQLARALTPDFVRPFGVLVRNLVDCGELNVSGWSSLALTTLIDICKRHGFEVDTKDKSLLERMIMEVADDKYTVQSYDHHQSV